jgi:hypothetical protein
MKSGIALLHFYNNVVHKYLLKHCIYQQVKSLTLKYFINLMVQLYYIYKNAGDWTSIN